MTKKKNIDVTHKGTSGYVNRLLAQEDEVQPITNIRRNEVLETNATFFANKIKKKLQKKFLHCV